MAYVQSRSWVPTLLLAALVVCMLQSIYSHSDVVSIGGFVTVGSRFQAALSETGARGSVDLSGVRIVVLSPHGVRLTDGDCSPNGYYFIPIDAGTYTVHVQGRPGWIFNPQTAQITCSAQSCNSGNDVNFELAGMQLSGYVAPGKVAPSCKASTGSFSGISVTVKYADSHRKLKTAQVVDSSFSIGALLPGTYIISAAHPDWQLSPSQITHTLTLDSPHLPQPFQIAGYTLSGSVTSHSGPVAGIQVTLLSTELASAGCSATHPPGTVNADDIESALSTTALCSVLSDANGQYSFPGVPCGQYSLQAQHPDTSSTFEVVPSSMSVSLGHSNAVVQQAFTVIGFSVQGRVIDSSGAGVAGVDIEVAGQVRATTDLNGRYSLARMHAGRIDVTATKKHYTCSSLKAVHVTPTAQLLPDISILSMSVCGRLAYGEQRFKVNARRVSLASTDGASVAEQTSADKADSFCFTVPPGQYRITPYVTADEKAKGLVFSPAHADIHLAAEPVFNIVFSQALLTVTGSVVCLDGPCHGDVHIALKDAAGKHAAWAGLEEVEVRDRHSTGRGSSFQFTKVSPGQYTLVASKPGWCWSEEPGVEVTVDFSDVQAPPLKQAGYELQVSSSHAADLTIEGPLADSFFNANVDEGLTRICMPGSGIYTITPHSCFVFGPDGTFSVDVTPQGPPERLALHATQVYVKGSVVVAATDKLPSSINIHAEVHGADPPQVLASEAVATHDEPRGVFSYSLAIDLGAEIIVTPSVMDDSRLLFYPSSVTYKHHAALKPCPPALPSIESKNGKMLHGITEPSVEGAQVTVTYKGSSEAAGNADGDVAMRSITNASGSFTIGPLHDEAEYDVEITKPGFIFTPAGVGTDDQLKFIVKQLAQVAVNVELPDAVDPAVVFLSLSGSGGFKNNSRLGPDRALTFVGLQPGRYYLKPLLREHQFEPPVADLMLEDGQAAELTLTAVRTAWGISGSVTSVGGSPIAGAVVEACQGTGAAAVVLDSSMTDVAGEYRIGNLKPDTVYEVRVKCGGHVIIAHPAAKQVNMQRSDASGIDFVAVRYSSRPALSAALKLPTEFRNAIKAELLPAATSGTGAAPTAATAVDGSGFFEMRGLKPGSYVLRLSCDPAAAGGMSCETWEKHVQVPAKGVHLGVLPYTAAPLSTFRASSIAAAHVSDEGLDWKVPALVLVLLIAGTATVFKPAVVDIFQLRPISSNVADGDAPAGFGPPTNANTANAVSATVRNGTAAIKAEAAAARAAAVKAAAATPLRSSAPSAARASWTAATSEAAAEPLLTADDIDDLADVVDGGNSVNPSISSGDARASSLKQRNGMGSRSRARRA